MPEHITAYRIFIASPGGLEMERQTFRDTISAYNESDAIHRKVHFLPIGWEITLGGIGRPQALINADVQASDYFVLVLWDRWGSATRKRRNSKFSSGTEEEYNVALRCFQQGSMRQVVVFFKAVESRQLSDPGEQLQKVLVFKKKLEAEKRLLFDTFDQLSKFQQKLRCYLAQWLRDHDGESEGEGSGFAKPPDDGGSPQLFVRSSLKYLSTPPDRKSPQKHLVREAERLFQTHRFTDAEAKFAQAVAKGTDFNAFHRFAQFLVRTDRLSQAKANYERLVDLSKATERLNWEAFACENIGNICHMAGEFGDALKAYKKALVLNQRLGLQTGVTRNLGNLALTYHASGKLSHARLFLSQALSTGKDLPAEDQFLSKGIRYAVNRTLDHFYLGLMDYKRELTSEKYVKEPRNLNWSRRLLQRLFATLRDRIDVLRFLAMDGIRDENSDSVLICTFDRTRQLQFSGEKLLRHIYIGNVTLKELRNRITELAATVQQIRKYCEPV